MPNEPPPAKPRRKPNVLWLIASGFALLAGLFLYQLFGPNRSIIVARQTTHITEPLRADGLPDYRQYLLDVQRQGVTPENNAAVLMWQAMGPGTGSDLIKPADWILLAAELKLPPIDDSTKYITPLYGPQNRSAILNWVVQNAPQLESGPPADTQALAQLGLTQQDIDADEFIGAAMGAPWRAEQLPPMAEWVAANQAQLDLLVEAAARSRFYSPPLEMLHPAEDDASMVSFAFEAIQQMREVARMLALRAMLHIGEGQQELAWKDLFATHRWARHISQGTTLVEQLVAIAIDGIACQGTAALLGNDRLSPELAHQIQRDLATLGPATRMAEAFDSGERIFGLSGILDVRRDGFGILTAGWMYTDNGEPKPHPLDFVSLDWNAPLVECNRIYDQLAAACRIANYAVRKRAVRNIDREIQQMDTEFRSPAAWAISTVSPARRGEMLAAGVISMLAPSLTACIDADDRSIAKTELIQIAAVLAVYRAEIGNFPDSLDALVPHFLPQLPVDYFNAKPFVYRRQNDGYLLYTLGENGIDDGGSNELMSILAGQSVHDLPEEQQEAAAGKIPPGADDISILVPKPPFTLPAPTAATEPSDD